jgi:hypothetical protein
MSTPANIYVLSHSIMDLFAVWGEDESEPTGPMNVCHSNRSRRV